MFLGYLNETFATPKAAASYYGSSTINQEMPHSSASPSNAITATPSNTQDAAVRKCSYNKVFQAYFLLCEFEFLTFNVLVLHYTP